MTNLIPTADEYSDMTAETREAWLLAATDVFRGWFAAAELPLPANVRVSVGFPRGARKVIGQCWYPETEEDGWTNLFISPTLDNPIQVLATLLHELIHAALGPGHGHKSTFAKYAQGMGLTGKMTATIPGPVLTDRLTIIADGLGAYPHTAVNDLAAKVQTTRMLKVMCVETECAFGGEYVVRMTRKWLDMVGAPICPACETHMTEV